MVGWGGKHGWRPSLCFSRVGIPLHMDVNVLFPEPVTPMTAITTSPGLIGAQLALH